MIYFKKYHKTMENDFLKLFKKRYSCKNFLETKKVNQQDLDELIEIFRLSPSMLNIQPWKIFIIENKQLKQELQRYSSDQKQVWTNSHYIVFARKNKIDDNYISDIVKWLKNENLAFESIKNFLSWMNEKQKEIWAISQVSIALWNIIWFLALKQIDSCPIWIFDREKYDEILGLKEKWYSSVFNIAIWYASEKKFIINKKRLNSDIISEYVK